MAGLLLVPSSARWRADCRG